MKAIHNSDAVAEVEGIIVSNMSKILNESNSQRKQLSHLQILVVSNMSKILNESNSQQFHILKVPVRRCFQYVKDTK